jgi:cobalt/nickel transport system ATP-binding protein
MKNPLLEVDGVAFAYRRGVTALAEISLQVGEGEGVALVGANGAGKSTLLLLLAGLHSPTGGSLRWRGETVDDRMLRCHCGILLQDPEDQIFAPTVEQDVVFGLVQRGVREVEARGLARAALDRMGIPHLAERPIRALSLGEKKRTALAGLLVLRPAMLLLDEPTAGLDHSAILALEATLGDLRDTGTAIVLSTHDTDFAARWAGQVLVLEHGEVAAAGPPPSVLLDKPLLRRAGLAMPACYAAAEALGEAFPLCATWPVPATHEQLQQFISRLARHAYAGDLSGAVGLTASGRD